MKVLLDSCVWGGAKTALVDAGHDVVWVGDRAKDPGDEQILSEAHLDERVFVTLDKDFGALAVLWGAPHHGIIRLVNIPARQQGKFVAHVLSLYGSEILSGAIATVESNRIRIRPPDDPLDHLHDFPSQTEYAYAEPARSELIGNGIRDQVGMSLKEATTW